MAKILLVDDAAFMRMMLKDILTKLGHEIVGEAADGVEGVAQFEKLNPDLVLMDITMPNKNGIEAVEAIMKLNDKAKVVMCSAMGQKGMVVDAIKAGAKDFIVKPFQSDRINEAVSKVLQ